MKTTTRKLWRGGAAIAAFLLAFSVSAYATGQNVSVTNNDTEAITLTVNCSDGGHEMTVGAASNQQESVGAILSITINGQTLNVGVNGTVTLPDMSQVNVTWGTDPKAPQSITIVISEASS